MKQKFWPLVLYFFVEFQTLISGKEMAVGDLITMDPAPRYFVDMTFDVNILVIGNTIWLQFKVFALSSDFLPDVIFQSEKFFEIFPRIIVYPNLDLSDLAARYNRRYSSVPNFVPVEIWWRMYRYTHVKRKDFQDWQRVNTTFPRTVSTWYFDVSPSALTEFLQDAEKHLEQNFFGENGITFNYPRIAVPISLEYHNCTDIVNQFFNLTTTTSLQKYIYPGYQLNIKLFDCLKQYRAEKNHTSTNINFVDVDITYGHILYRNGRFQVSCKYMYACNLLDLVTNDIDNDNATFAIYRINVTDSGITKHPDRVLCGARDTNKKNWTEAGLSKRMGFSIYFDTTLNYTAFMLFQIAATSPNLLVENKYLLDDSSKERFQNFVDKFLLMLETYSKEVNSSILSRDIKLKSVLFRANFEFNDIFLLYSESIPSISNFKSWATLFEDTARKINTLVPNLVVGFIFRFEPLDHFKQSENQKWLFKAFPLLQQPNKTSELKFGLQGPLNIQPDHHICSMLLDRYFIFDLVVLEFSVDFNRQCLSAYQPVLTEEALDDFLSCGGSKDYLNKFPQGKLIIFIHIRFCNTNSSQSEEDNAQYELVVDRLNTLSMRYKINFYIASGIREPSDPLRTDLFEKSCSWWHVETNATGFRHLNTRRSEIANTTKRAPPDSEYTKEAEGEIKWSWILLMVLVACITTIGISVSLVLRYRSKYLHQYDEIKALLKGQALPNDVTTDTANAEALGSKYDKEKLEIPKSQFTIDSSKSLGSGEFGHVHLGTITQQNETIPVAIKTTKQSSRAPQLADLIALRGLISEIKLLSYVGTHKNIVAFLGAYTEKIGRGYIAVFLEYCSNGCLLNFLRKCKPQLPRDSDNDANVQILESEHKHNLMRWSYEIVTGMEYLSSKKIVHADVAARNILLDSKLVAKVADFGLSRRLYNYTNYVKKKQEPLPWRWMAPEALRNSVFNEKTDVWAYGILLWEIFTLGDLPYPGLNWDMEFASKLALGLRLPMPMYNQMEMFIVMLRCWHNNPDSRPTFATIKADLESKLENEDLVEHGAVDGNVDNTVM